MLTVVTPENVLHIIRQDFSEMITDEKIPLSSACGRILSENITATEFIPDFDRSTVDGYAVHAADTFGCSDSIPAILPLDGEIQMGMPADTALPPGHCIYVPTGGAVPEGADAVVMIEYTENYRDGTIGIAKPVAPGNNMIFKGDDVFPGKTILSKGRSLNAPDIGALAAMGQTFVPVKKKPIAGILSTGDELVDISETPKPGQVRDVNSSLLAAGLMQWGCDVRNFGIIRDEEELLSQAVRTALDTCDVVLISGGSSVGTKDATCRVIAGMGEILFHGIAMKPGKPTIFGKVGAKPVIGLPGHPVAAHFVSTLFVRPLIARLQGTEFCERTVPAILSETVSANHGRAQYTGVHLQEKDGLLYAIPIHAKSGLIASLAGSDGYFCIPRDCEGVKSGTEVLVHQM